MQDLEWHIIMSINVSCGLGLTHNWSDPIIIIIIERKDLGGVMSKDCEDTLQNSAKDSDKTRVRRKVRTEYLSDAIVGRAVEIRKTEKK